MSFNISNVAHSYLDTTKNIVIKTISEKWKLITIIAVSIISMFAIIRTEFMQSAIKSYQLLIHRAIYFKEFKSINDLNTIYNQQFQYFFPRQTLEAYLSGKGFDYKKEYTKSEFNALQSDVFHIYKEVTKGISKTEHPVAIITAGSPGVGKTTLIKELHTKDSSPMAYVCPDDVCLLNMETYQSHAKQNNQTDAYTKWRPGSNAIMHIALANLIRDKYSFYFGSACASPHVTKLFQFLKDQGYKIKLIHVTASDDVRWSSIQNRDKTFVQTTEEDIIKKGKDVPQRVYDFLNYADEIDFYYRSAPDASAQLAVQWKCENSQKRIGKFKPVNQQSYDSIQKIHDDICKSLTTPNKTQLLWEKIVEKHSIK